MAQGAELPANFSPLTADAPRVRPGEGRCAWRTLWLAPHLLSLDAPAVAVGWQIWWARIAGAKAGLLENLILALAVWMVYIADRLADSKAPPFRLQSTDRHRFYRRWGAPLGLMLCVIASILVTLSVTELSMANLRAGLLLLAAVAGYFVLVHSRPGLCYGGLPKEAWVAGLFALGTAFFTLRGGPEPGMSLLIPLSLFGVLCFLNCSLIAKWECCPSDLSDPSSLLNLSPRLVEMLGSGCWILAGAAAIASAASPKAPLACAPLVLGAVGLGALDACSARCSKTALRVLADAVLLGPWLFVLAG